MKDQRGLFYGDVGVVGSAEIGCTQGSCVGSIHTRHPKYQKEQIVVEEKKYRCDTGTHYNACDCREAKMARVIEAAKESVNRYFYSLDNPASALRYLEETIRDYEGKK